MTTPPHLEPTSVRVLVVDDEVNIAELITMALRYEGWDVKSALSGEAAVAEAAVANRSIIAALASLSSIGRTPDHRMIRRSDTIWGARSAPCP